MQTLKPIDPSTATAKTKQLLAAFEQLRGRSSNMLRVVAQSPPILEAYLQFNRAFEHTRMSTRLRGLITVAMAQHLGCEYMLSVAAAVGTREGLSSEEFEAARNAESHDPKIAQALRSEERRVGKERRSRAEQVSALHEAGYGD